MARLKDAERIPDDLLQQWTERIRAGEKGAQIEELARFILNDFILRARFDQPQSTHVLRWLAEILEETLDNGKPGVRRAFSLPPRPEGRRAEIADSIYTAIWVECACELGFSDAEAKRWAAVAWGCDEKTVARRMKGAGDTSVRNPDLSHWQHFFGGIGKSLPERKRKRKETRTLTR